MATGSTTAQEPQIAETQASVTVEIAQTAAAGQPAGERPAVAGHPPLEAEAEAAAEAEMASALAENAAEEALLAAELDPQLWRMRRYVRVNCALARRVCDLSASEEDAFAHLNDAWLATQIHQAVEMPGVGAMVGILRFLGGAAGEQRPREVKLPDVKHKIDAAIDEALTPEHREIFQRERDARVNFRKQALAAALVSVLDKNLFLSTEQRSQLEPVVAAWLTTDLYWEFYFQQSGYLPDIPRHLLAKVLSPEQLAVVQGMQRFNYERSRFEDQMDQEPVMIER